MTVIAYKDGLMACDSAWSSNSTLQTRRSKIVRMASGGILGSAGEDDSRAIEELLSKVKSIAGLPSRKQLLELQLDYAGILVLPKGRIIAIDINEPEEDMTHWTGGLYEVAEGYFAVGSGAVHALTAMECGKSAKEACELAIRRDMNCRPPIYVVSLLREKPKKSSEIA